MSNTATVLAFDFGASSGRAIRAVYDGQNLTYEEIHRFENFPIEKDGHLCWNVETLLKEIHTAIAPGDLPCRIQEFCRKTGQPVPETVGAVMRCIYESLALKYHYAIEQLSAVTGRTFTTLHVLGGGTKDRLLCQMTADCCGLTVKAGPVEATALGNIMIQLKALGVLDSITQGRRLIAETEVIKTYTPSTQNYAEWNAAYDRFKTLL